MPGFIHRSRLVKKTAVLCTMFSASAIFFSGCGGYGAEPPQCMTSVSDLADEQALRQENEKVFIPETRSMLFWMLRALPAKNCSSDAIRTTENTADHTIWQIAAVSSKKRSVPENIMISRIV